MIGKKYTPIESWIWEHLQPVESDSATQSYDNILLQGGGKLPLINTPLNLRDIAHFADEAQIQEFVAATRDAQDILDIGTGDGWPALRIAPFVRMVTAIDASARRIEVSRANAAHLHIHNVRFQKMSAVALDFSTGSFEVVIAASSIEQTPNPIRALEEVYRVLKPGGRFLVSFESLDVALDRPLVERVALREHFDGTAGWYYCLKHRDPPWERNYLVRFKSTPEVAQAFARARDILAQAGDNPAQVREIGIELLESQLAQLHSSSYYELEHFTTKTMVETLEDIGFENVRGYYSAARLARLFFPQINVADLTDLELQELAHALGQMALHLPAPTDQGQPVMANKPETSDR
ncbi:MAG: class I SAM-dependent methyltransferase [candidate division WOR-3 bacterium]